MRSSSRSDWTRLAACDHRANQLEYGAALSRRGHRVASLSHATVIGSSVMGGNVLAAGKFCSCAACQHRRNGRGACYTHCASRSHQWGSLQPRGLVHPGAAQKIERSRHGSLWCGANRRLLSRRDSRACDVRVAPVAILRARAYWWRPMARGGGGDFWASPRGDRPSQTPGCGLDGFRLDRCGVLVHGIHIVCKPCHHDCPLTVRYLCRYSAAGRAGVRAGAARWRNSSACSLEVPIYASRDPLNPK